ncbi:MAG: hypothetical protein HYW25_02725 [Candidatus Aenigmarchaeota archaeon]|nr:hypothetical protein [Candidatus Aenigmarchaeota archaeon]
MEEDKLRNDLEKIVNIYEVGQEGCRAGIVDELYAVIRKHRDQKSDPNPPPGLEWEREDIRYNLKL